MATANMACSRCQKVLALSVQVDNEEYDGDSPETVDVTLPGGRLMAVCVSCCTTREAVQEMMELNAKTLQVNEDFIEQIESVGAVVPALLEDPKVKASLAQARQRVVEARAWLQALAETEHEIEDD